MSDNENDGVYDLLKRRGLSVDRLQRMKADKVCMYRIVSYRNCSMTTFTTIGYVFLLLSHDCGTMQTVSVISANTEAVVFL